MDFEIVGVDFYALKQRSLSPYAESVETLAALVIMVLFTVQPREYVMLALNNLKANKTVFQKLQDDEIEALLNRLLVFERNSFILEAQLRMYEIALRHYVGYLLKNPKICLRTIEKYLTYLPEVGFTPEFGGKLQPSESKTKEKGKANKTAHWLKTYRDILATARYLAVRESFQSALTKLRAKYGIVHGFASESAIKKILYANGMGEESPEDVLVRYIKIDTTSISQVLIEIRERLCDPYPDLKWELHSGLIVAALCFGLDENQLVNASAADWRLLWALGRQFRYAFGVSYDLDFNYREPFLDALDSLKYLAGLLNQEQLENIPASVKLSLRYATECVVQPTTEIQDNVIERKRIPIVTKPIILDRCHPVIRVDRSTRLDADVPVIWPIIESMREAFLGRPAKGLVWQDYRRDLYLETAAKDYTEKGKQVDWDEIFDIYIQEQEINERRDKGLRGNHRLKSNKLVKAVANLNKKRKM